MKICIRHDANDSWARLRGSSSIRVVWRQSQHCWAPAFRIPPGFAIFLSLAAETLFRPNMIQEEGIINLLATGSKVGASRRLLQLLGLVRIFRRKIGPARGGPRRSRSRT